MKGVLSFRDNILRVNKDNKLEDMLLKEYISLLEFDEPLENEVLSPFSNLQELEQHLANVTHNKKYIYGFRQYINPQPDYKKIDKEFEIDGDYIYFNRGSTTIKQHNVLLLCVSTFHTYPKRELGKQFFLPLKQVLINNKVILQELTECYE